MPVNLSTFFGYPEPEPDSVAAEELVFLGEHGEDDWTRLLSYTEVCRFRAGDVVVRQGDAQRALYIVSRGTLDVVAGTRRDARVLSTVEAGSIFGEQAFLDGRPRSATVLARTECELLELSLESFEALAAREPKLARDVLFNLGRILSIRLRQASAVVSSIVG